MKVLSFLLAAAMVSAAAVMPVSVSAEENAGGVLICEENFDEITGLADLKGDAASKTGWGYYYVENSASTGDQYGFEGSKYIDLVKDENGNQYLYTYQNNAQSGENALYFDLSGYSEGQVVFDYDIKFDLGCRVNMRTGYGKRADNLVAEAGAVYNNYWVAANKQQLAEDNTIQAGTWYHVTMTTDWNNKKMVLKIVDPSDDGVVLYEKVAGLDGVAKRFGINVEKPENGIIPVDEKRGAYLDNVKITHIPKAGPAMLPMNETFDYADVDEMVNAGWWFEGASNNVSKIDGEKFMLGLPQDANPDNQQAKRLFTPVTSGAVSIEWDVVTSEYTNAIVKLWGPTSTGASNNIFPIFFKEGGEIYYDGNPGNKTMGTHTPGEQYHCKAVINIDTDEFYVTVTDTENKVVAEQEFTHNVDEIKEITLQTWTNTAFESGETEVSYVTFDNLEIKQIPSVSAPVWADGTINANDDYFAKIATFTVKPNGVTNFGVEVNVGEQSQTKHIENVESEIKFGIILISDDENNLVTDNVTAGIAD